MVLVLFLILSELKDYRNVQIIEISTYILIYYFTIFWENWLTVHKIEDLNITNTEPVLM